MKHRPSIAVYIRPLWPTFDPKQPIEAMEGLRGNSLIKLLARFEEAFNGPAVSHTDASVSGQVGPVSRQGYK